MPQNCCMNITINYRRVSQDRRGRRESKGEVEERKAETGGGIYGGLKSPSVSWSTENLKESVMPIPNLPLSMEQAMDVEEISSGL